MTSLGGFSGVTGRGPPSRRYFFRRAGPSKKAALVGPTPWGSFGVGEVMLPFMGEKRCPWEVGSHPAGEKRWAWEVGSHPAGEKRCPWKVRSHPAGEKRWAWKVGSHLAGEKRWVWKVRSHPAGEKRCLWEVRSPSESEVTSGGM